MVTFGDNYLLKQNNILETFYIHTPELSSGGKVKKNLTREFLVGKKYPSLLLFCLSIRVQIQSAIIAVFVKVSYLSLFSLLRPPN